MEILNKIKSVKLCLMAHPDNETDSEFADRISDLEEIENELSKDKWIKIESEIDLPDEFYELWVVSKENGEVRFREFFGNEKRGFASIYSYYQKVIKPDLPLT
jgi:hypothetical protein